MVPTEILATKATKVGMWCRLELTGILATDFNTLENITFQAGKLSKNGVKI